MVAWWDVRPTFQQRTYLVTAGMAVECQLLLP